MTARVRVSKVRLPLSGVYKGVVVFRATARSCEITETTPLLMVGRLVFVRPFSRPLVVLVIKGWQSTSKKYLELPDEPSIRISKKRPNALDHEKKNLIFQTIKS